MSTNSNKAQNAISKIEQIKPIEHFAEQLRPRTQEEISSLANDQFDYKNGSDGQQARIDFLEKKGIQTQHLTGKKHLEHPDLLKGNIENFIGMAQIPIGLAGPLLINGTAANGDFYLPLATSEGALVASYNRGMKACRLSGGITSVCLTEGVQRSPFFKFNNMSDLGTFVKWIYENLETFKSIVTEVSNYAKITELKTNIEGNSIILTFEYHTGDAAGQNMVTICTDRVCRYIVEHSPITPNHWYIESNFSGDKKATVQSFLDVRGKKVSAEIVLKRAVVEKVLKSTPEQMAAYWQSSTLAVIQSGAIGAQGHIANGLTALFISCGQDVACISESSVGLTRMEVNAEKDLYVSLTLPSLIVGTIGGGTNLPTQRECLEMIDCHGVGKARKFAEICCALALAGEVSIASAMSVDHFTRAHELLGRKKG